MPKFRKKPVVVDAVQFTGNSDGDPRGVWRREEDRSPYVITIHGQRCYIEPGDWILPEPDGVHYYPVKPDIFAATYNALPDGMNAPEGFERVRALVRIDSQGDYVVRGARGPDEDAFEDMADAWDIIRTRGEADYFIEVDVPLPKAPVVVTVAGELVEEVRRG